MARYELLARHPSNANDYDPEIGVAAAGGQYVLSIFDYRGTTVARARVVRVYDSEMHLVREITGVPCSYTGHQANGKVLELGLGKWAILDDNLDTAECTLRVFSWDGTTLTHNAVALPNYGTSFGLRGVQRMTPDRLVVSIGNNSTNECKVGVYNCPTGGAVTLSGAWQNATGLMAVPLRDNAFGVIDGKKRTEANGTLSTLFSAYPALRVYKVAADGSVAISNSGNLVTWDPGNDDNPFEPKRWLREAGRAVCDGVGHGFIASQPYATARLRVTAFYMAAGDVRPTIGPSDYMDEVSYWDGWYGSAQTFFVTGNQKFLLGYNEHPSGGQERDIERSWRTLTVWPPDGMFGVSFNYDTTRLTFGKLPPADWSEPPPYKGFDGPFNGVWFVDPQNPAKGHVSGASDAAIGGYSSAVRILPDKTVDEWNLPGNWTGYHGETPNYNWYDPGQATGPVAGVNYLRASSAEARGGAKLALPITDPWKAPTLTDPWAGAAGEGTTIPAGQGTRSERWVRFAVDPYLAVRGEAIARPELLALDVPKLGFGGGTLDRVRKSPHAVDPGLPHRWRATGALNALAGTWTDEKGGLVFSSGANEMHQVEITGATGGTFTLTFSGHTTAAIAFNAASTAIQAALEALPSIGKGNVYVDAPANNVGGFGVEYRGTLARTDVPLLTGSPALLTGTVGFTISQRQNWRAGGKPPDVYSSAGYRIGPRNNLFRRAARFYGDEWMQLPAKTGPAFTWAAVVRPHPGTGAWYGLLEPPSTLQPKGRVDVGLRVRGSTFEVFSPMRTLAPETFTVFGAGGPPMFVAFTADAATKTGRLFVLSRSVRITQSFALSPGATELDLAFLLGRGRGAARRRTSAVMDLYELNLAYTALSFSQLEDVAAILDPAYGIRA